ncbi:MAG: hypothetical protein LBU11_03350 [Zoogloeaceae bacterium]|nr:hypothetical protein [Zoogloeaceae bacterium]
MMAVFMRIAFGLGKRAFEAAPERHHAGDFPGLFRRGLALKCRQGAPLASRTANAGMRALMKFMARQAWGWRASWVIA